jgi:HK97 family phage major capsid protein
MKLAAPFDWASLNAEADRLGIHVVARAISAKVLQEQLDELLDEAEALKALADSKEGLSKDDEARWDELFGPEGDEEAAEPKGEINVLAKKLTAAKRFEGQKKKVAALRLMQNSGSPFAAGGATGAGEAAVPVLSARHVMLPTKAFKGEDAAKDAYACGMWLRALIAKKRGGRDETAEAVIAQRGWAVATEGVTTAGGYLVPDPLSAAFIEYRQKVGVVRALADVRVMTSDTLTIPKLSSGPSVKYPGEGGAITASDQVWAQVALAAVKRAILSYVSQELKDDAIINITDELVSRMAYEFAKQEDNEAINGDGTSTYGGETGLLAAIGSAGVSQAATGHDTWPELDTSDLAAWFAKLPSQHWNNPGVLCSVAFYELVLHRLMAAGGGNTMQALQQGVPRPTPTPPSWAARSTSPTRCPRAPTAATVCALYGNFSEASCSATAKTCRSRSAISTSSIWTWSRSAPSPATTGTGTTSAIRRTPAPWWRSRPLPNSQYARPRLRYGAGRSLNRQTQNEGKSP